ncbi:MAG: MFS transporter [Pikeienuella sp.]
MSRSRIAQEFPLDQADSLPFWRRPFFMLALMAMGSAMAFATWMAVISNFIIEVVHFDGSENGWMHTVREIPGFMAFLAIFIFALIKEQTFGLISLALLGIGTAVTAEFPTFQGVLLATFVSSLGFHYYETVAQSLQLQWLPKDKAPRLLGWITAAGSAGSLIAYGVIVATWKTFDLSYATVLYSAGGVCVAIALYCRLVFPTFKAEHAQRHQIVLKTRYWLYYALVFMGGARRQIFVVFAAFMMVELFGFELHHVTGLLLINYVVAMLFAPVVGQLITYRGERFTMILEYIGLIIVFVLYAGVYWFEWPWEVAAVLYVVDHILFSMAFAQKTYFQKIADPEDQAPTAAVAFTINHIAAVFLPAALGYLWLISPSSVYVLAASMAVVSLVLATLAPRHPEKGRETVFSPAAVTV